MEVGRLEHRADPQRRLRRARRRACRRSARGRCVGVASPSSIRSVVVLPAPFGPRKPVIVPGSSANERSSTARTVPNRLVSDSARTTAVMRLPGVLCGARLDAERAQQLGRRIWRPQLEQLARTRSGPGWGCPRRIPLLDACSTRLAEGVSGRRPRRTVTRRPRGDRCDRGRSAGAAEPRRGRSLRAPGRPLPPALSAPLGIGAEDTCERRLHQQRDQQVLGPHLPVAAAACFLARECTSTTGDSARRPVRRGRPAHQRTFRAWREPTGG